MDLLWLKCKTFTCIGSASVPGGDLIVTTRCNKIDAGVVTLTIVHMYKNNHTIRPYLCPILVSVCVFLFLFWFSYVHSRVSTYARSLAPSLSTGSYLGVCYLVS